MRTERFRWRQAAGACLLIAGVLGGTPAVSAERSFYVPSVETHLIKSKHVDQTYQIQVMQPLMKKGEKERFPVLYITDANVSFDFAKAIAHSLQISGQVRRFIVVGIGYPGDNPMAGSIFRGRDYTSHRRPEIPGLPRQSPVEGVVGIEEGKKRWQGAGDFLNFISKELVPLIDAKYPTVAGDRAYAGDSLGGGLGLHALFSHPGIFNRYILTSPSISYDGDDYGIREAKEFIASGKPLNAQVVINVGGEEEFDPSPAVAKPQFVSSVYRMVALLLKAKIQGLDVSSRVYPGETHASVWPMAFSHGVQTLYGPAERPPMAL